MKRLSKRCFPSIVLQRIDIRCSWVSGSLTRNNYRDCKSLPLNPRITNPRGQKFQSHCSRSTGIAPYNDSLTPIGIGHDMLLNTTDTQCLILCQPYCQPLGIVFGLDNQLYVLYCPMPLPGGKRKSLYTCIIHFCSSAAGMRYAQRFSMDSQR